MEIPPNFRAHPRRAGRDGPVRVSSRQCRTLLLSAVLRTVAVRGATVCQSVAVVVRFLPGQGYSWVNSSSSYGNPVTTQASLPPSGLTPQPTIRSPRPRIKSSWSPSGTLHRRRSWSGCIRDRRSSRSIPPRARGCRSRRKLPRGKGCSGSCRQRSAHPPKTRSDRRYRWPQRPYSSWKARPVT